MDFSNRKRKGGWNKGSDPDGEAVIADVLLRAERQGTELSPEALSFIIYQEQEIRTMQALIALLLEGTIDARLCAGGDLARLNDYSFSARNADSPEDG